MGLLVPEQRLGEMQRLDARQRRQWQDQDILALRPAGVVLGPVIHQHRHSRRRQRIEQRIEQRLAVGVHPVQILEDEQERPLLGKPSKDGHQAGANGLTPAARFHLRPIRVLRIDVEQCECRDEYALQPIAQRAQASGDGRADRGHLVDLGNAEQVTNQPRQGVIGAVGAKRDGTRSQHVPAIDQA